MSKWEMVRIGELGKIVTGNTPKTSDENNYSSQDICFFKPSDINEEKITILYNSENWLSECARDKVRMLPKNSVLVTCIGTIGKIGIIRREATCNQQINAIIPNENVDSRALAYAILSKQEQLQAIANAPVVPIINKTQFSDFKIPLPPLDVQKHIADILDKTQGIIDGHNKQLEELDNLIKAVFYDMFGNLSINDKGWEYQNFTEVATIDTKMTKDFDKYACVPHIGIDSIEKNTGEILEFKLVKDSNLISGKYYFNEQHIIYSKIRPNLNKVAIPNFEGLCSADAYPILPNIEKANRYYLAYLLRSDYFLNYILGHSDRTNIPKVNKQQLENLEAILPPLDLQNKFAQIVAKIEEQKSIVKQSLKESQNLFNSLMCKYFD